MLQCLRDGSLLGVQPCVVRGENLRVAPLLRDPPDQKRGRDREDQSEYPECPPQLGAEVPAQLLVRRHDDEQLRVAERDGDRLSSSVEQRATRARRHQVATVGLVAQVQRIPEIRERGVRGDGRLAIPRQGRLGVDDITGLRRADSQRVAEPAVGLGEQIVERHRAFPGRALTALSARSLRSRSPDRAERRPRRSAAPRPCRSATTTRRRTVARPRRSDPSAGGRRPGRPSSTPRAPQPTRAASAPPGSRPLRPHRPPGPAGAAASSRCCRAASGLRTTGPR